MYFLIAFITHLFGGGCMAYPYENKATKDLCCVCKKKMKTKEEE